MTRRSTSVTLLRPRTRSRSTAARPRRHGQDALTGLLDATAFEEAMSHEEARQKRYGHPATVIVFELDGLAKLVDRLGSDTGRPDRNRPRRRHHAARPAGGPCRASRSGALRRPPAGDRRDRRDQLRRADPPCLRSMARVGCHRDAVGHRLGEHDRRYPGCRVRSASRPIGCGWSSVGMRVGSGTWSPVPRPGPGIWATSRTTPSGSDGQSTPSRIARPGVAPVCSPSLTTSVPLTMTSSMPVGY